MRAANQVVLADPEHRFGNNLDYKKRKKSGNGQSEALDPFFCLFVCSVFCVLGGFFVLCRKTV